ncbi:putative ribokinase [Clavispora lusitaniae]|uniref:Ribokinase n=1 Tax=Clavispora lusitaniae TaxID=36911 RepID=A0AA91T185_CLALS|nr:putative ribokinase [Clavispora lusitaniae]
MITVIGSLNYDLVTYTDKVPEAGETFQANAFENHHGGKGLNEALACAKFGIKKKNIDVWKGEYLESIFPFFLTDDSEGWY